jgi:hypothetical protein
MIVRLHFDSLLARVVSEAARSRSGEATAAPKRLRHLVATKQAAHLAILLVSVSAIGCTAVENLFSTGACSSAPDCNQYCSGGTCSSGSVLCTSDGYCACVPGYEYCASALQCVPQGTCGENDAGCPLGECESADASIPRDAGPPSDAGTRPDAGTDQDAGVDAGTPCGVDGDCPTNLCRSGFCASCTSNTDCATNACEQGVCVCSTAFDCASNQICSASGSCENCPGNEVPCPETDACTDTTQPANCGSCGNACDSQQNGGTCNDTKGQCMCAWSNGSGGDSKQCAVNGNGCFGASCSSDSECCVGTCDGQHCCAKPGSPCQANAECGDTNGTDICGDSPSTAHLVCDPGTNACCVDLTGGCNSSADCCGTNTCINISFLVGNRCCLGQGWFGAGCSNNSDCCNDNCSFGYCVP